MGARSQQIEAGGTRSGGLVSITRALISVSDKTGVIELARALSARGVQIISTGGTAAALEDADIAVTPVEQITGFPEMMDGRVKTLHPKVHGGILAVRSNAQHVRAMTVHGIEGIDLVCVNLYPFKQAAARPGAIGDELIELIDIGGPALMRSAAKNHRDVVVLSDPAQYEDVVQELTAHNGATTLQMRRELAGAAFARTSGYDAAIARTFESGADTSGELPERLSISMPRRSVLRYGENPHQRAGLYTDAIYTRANIVSSKQLHGKDLSYNNVLDGAAALSLVQDLAGAHEGRFCCAIVKHANPCGAAVAGSSVEAAQGALAGDPVAAYGGVLGMSGSVGIASAKVLAGESQFLELIVAEGFEPDALALLRARWKNVRLLAVGPITSAPTVATLQVRTIAGGAVAQTPDDSGVDGTKWEHRAGPAPDAAQLRDAATIWLVCKHLTSNAVAIGTRDAELDCVRLCGAGAGQMDRVTACRLAGTKAGSPGHSAIAASDGFFPFADGPELLMQAGVTLIVHPGGSKRDGETFDLCDRMGVTCMTTGVRHFRH